MPYSHFLMLARRLDAVQAEAAYYTGLAVNAPAQLADIMRQAQPKQENTSLDMVDFLKTVNGR